jgi:hypothetical protein
MLGQATGDPGLTWLTMASTWGKQAPSLALCVCPRHLHPNDIFPQDSQGGVLKLSRFGPSKLWEFITPCSDLWSGWGFKKTCSFPWELSNYMSHSTCTHQGQVNCRILVVGSQIVNLIPNLFFIHKLCYKCLNGTCEAIFDIYTSRPFQQYKKHFKTRCFDPCNQTLSFWESRRTPKVPILRVWMSSSHSFKMKLRQPVWFLALLLFITCAANVWMAHVRPFSTFTLQNLSNDIKNTSRRGVLTSFVSCSHHLDIPNQNLFNPYSSKEA